MDYDEVLKKIDPAKRDWEYDGDGTKIYKLEAGFVTKTPYVEEEEEDESRTT